MWKASIFQSLKSKFMESAFLGRQDRRFRFPWRKDQCVTGFDQRDFFPDLVLDAVFVLVFTLVPVLEERPPLILVLVLVLVERPALILLRWAFFFGRALLLVVRFTALGPVFGRTRAVPVEAGEAGGFWEKSKQSDISSEAASRWLGGANPKVSSLNLTRLTCE